MEFQTAEEHLALELDLELRPKGIPVLLIHPGLPKTDMNMSGNITVDESAAGVYDRPLVLFVVGNANVEQGGRWTVFSEPKGKLS
jgi:NAD(P)-dependent dehydrogenase (short-subunit alcohol dehydrogenase family)